MEMFLILKNKNGVKMKGSILHYDSAVSLWLQVAYFGDVC